MRHIERIILGIGVSAALLGAQTDPPGRAGRLNYINGPVSFQPAGVTDWVDATINRPLTTGDHIWVGEGGQAEIHVGSTALRLNSNTAFNVSSTAESSSTNKIRRFMGPPRANRKILPAGWLLGYREILVEEPCGVTQQRRFIMKRGHVLR